MILPRSTTTAPFTPTPPAAGAQAAPSACRRGAKGALYVPTVGCRLPHSRLRSVDSNAGRCQRQVFIHPFIFKMAQTSRYLAFYRLPALHTPTPPSYLLVIGKRWALKVPSCCCPAEFPDPETPCAAELHHQGAWCPLHLFTCSPPLPTHQTPSPPPLY